LCDGPIRPYVSIAAGATYVDSISLHTWTNFMGQNIDVFDGPFYGESIVGTGTALFGLESRVTRRFSVGVDAGIRYQSTLCPNDREFDNLSNVKGVINSSSLAQDLSTLNNDAGDRLVIPVNFWAKLRF
jgi:hypothetical protein